MKRITAFFACAWLVGCASFSGPSASVDVVDSQKIQLIEQWARRNSVQVIWMNVPTRSVPADSTAAKVPPTRS